MSTSVLENKPLETSFGRLVAEMPATGGIVVSSEFRTVKLVRYVTTQDYVVLVFEFLFVLFIIYYIAEEIIEVTSAWPYDFSDFTHNYPGRERGNLSFDKIPTICY